VNEYKTDNITLLDALILQQPEVSSSMETTTSGITAPMEVASSHMQPVVMLETLNMSR